MDALKEMLTGALEETARLARTGQQVIDLSDGVSHLAERLADLHKREPELGPEILAAMGGLKECSEALSRALVANSAFVEDRRNRMFTEPEGGPSNV